MQRFEGMNAECEIAAEKKITDTILDKLHNNKEFALSIKERLSKVRSKLGFQELPEHNEKGLTVNEFSGLIGEIYQVAESEKGILTEISYILEQLERI